MGANWRPIPDDVRGTARRLTEELRAVKDRSGLSLTQIGARTHYSKASWERWFNGKRLITEHALESLAVSVDESARLLTPLLEQALLEAEQAAEQATPGQRPAVTRTVTTSAATTAGASDTSTARNPVARADTALPAAARLREAWRRYRRGVLLAVTSAAVGAAVGAYLAAPAGTPTAPSLDSAPIRPVSAPGRPSTPPPPCDGVGCAGKDPQSTGCVTDSKSLITQNVGKIVIYLHYSARCHAAWGGLTNAEPGDYVTVTTTAGDTQTAKVHWGYDNYSMMVDASDPTVGLQVCGYPPKGHGCTNTLTPPPAPTWSAHT